MTTSTQTQAPARFVTQYIQTMLWSTNDESTESGGYPLEDNYGVSDIAPETMQRIHDDCSRFWSSVESMGIDLDAELLIDDDATERAAHDFWLTRNGHGAGFWDGDWSDESEDRLTKLAESFGEQWPYVGDDGLIYL
jgi:hypothetical protein